MQNILVLIALICAAAVLIWLTARAWRLQNRLLKSIVVLLAAVPAVAVSLVGAVMIIGLAKQHGRTAPVPGLAVELTTQRVARGKAIADSFCSGCHSKTGTLTGGMDLADDIPIPIGSFIAPNLTPAGSLKRWSDGEIFRAIRNGVGADGNWLTIMSYTNTSRLSDDDTKAVIAYIRTLPAAGAPTREPPDRLSPLGIVMLGAGLLPSAKPIVTGIVTAPPKEPSSRFGEYILSYQDCRECHGQNLTGGVPGQLAPLGPDITLVKDWTLQDFITTMRTGVTPSGHKLGKQMPWQPIGRMDDDELAAVYEYLVHLPTP